MSIRVLLADDQALVRTGFRLVVAAHEDMTVVGEAADGAEAIALASRLDPDVVLMDVRMPRTDGIEATKGIVATAPRSRILILTTFDLDEYAFAALRAGASGFLLKDAPTEELARAIRAIAAGDAVVAPSVTRRLLDAYGHKLPDTLDRRSAHEHPALEALTPREREVLIEIATGYSNAEIAERLVLAEATVKTHVRRILSKLELRDRVQAVVFAYQIGLVRP